MRLLQVSLLLVSSAALGAAQGYINSCDGDTGTFEIPTFTVNCPKQDGTKVTSKLNLNDCFDLDGDKLVAKGEGDANPFDGFSGSDCSLDKGYVYCYTHEKKIESKNLDTVLSNYNGQISC